MMGFRQVRISASADTNLELEVTISHGVQPRTAYIEFVSILDGKNFRGQPHGWFTEEALDDLITVLQFAKLERFESD